MGGTVTVVVNQDSRCSPCGPARPNLDSLKGPIWTYGMMGYAHRLSHGSVMDGRRCDGGVAAPGAFI
jgi:hypothetical protein